MKWSDVTKADLEDALASIKHGHDPEAARNLIEYFYERLRDGCRFDERVLYEYLEYAFGRIVNENKSAAVAFGLKSARGEYLRPDTTERDAIAVAYMVLLMRSGRTWEEAKGDAANLLFPDGTGDKAVESAYRQSKEYFQTLPDQTLLDMLPDDTPVIKRVMTG